MPTLADVYSHVDVYVEDQVSRPLIDRWCRSGQTHIVNFTVWANQYITQDLAVYSDGLDIETLHAITDVGDPNKDKISMVQIKTVSHQSSGSLGYESWQRAQDYWALRTDANPQIWTTVGGKDGARLFVYPTPDRPDSGTSPAPTTVKVYGLRDTKTWLPFPSTVPFTGNAVDEEWQTIEQLFGTLLDYVVGEALDYLGQEGGDKQRDKFWLSLEQYRNATIPVNRGSIQVGGGTLQDVYPGTVINFDGG